MAKSLKFIIEALLFASEKPLTVRDIRACLPETAVGEIRSALKVLRYEYEAMGRSFTLKEVADGYQLRTHSEYGAYILKMLQTSPNRLSRAAMETLSIIAYKQPIIRQDVEKFRGVDVGGILRTLMEKGLIRIMGRKDLPGRPLIYGTTKKFLEVFDLKDLKSLPKLKEIKDLGVDEFEPGTQEQLNLMKAASSSGEKPEEQEDDSQPIAGDESTGDAAAEPPSPTETGEEDFQETDTAEPREAGQENEPGSPAETSGDDSAEDRPAEETSLEESGGEASDETELEESSLRQDADEEASRSIGVYETEETTETTSDETREEAPPTVEPSPEETTELVTTGGDSEPENL